jgi:hypothetical protein
MNIILKFSFFVLLLGSFATAIAIQDTIAHYQDHEPITESTNCFSSWKHFKHCLAKGSLKT